MGDQTDLLLKMAQQISREPPKRELDMLLSAGERMTMALLSMALQELGISSISLTGSQTGILTNSEHGNARIIDIRCDRLKIHLQTHNVAIVAGFQGVDPVSKEITTLGRGGSDLTAVALSVALQAKKCELYKDVPGIFTDNPHTNSSAKLLETISWSHAYELCAAGAQVVHARAVSLAQKYKIPVEVKSSFDLSAEPPKFTQMGDFTMEEPQIAAVYNKENQSLFKVSDLTRQELDLLTSELEHQILKINFENGSWNLEAYCESEKFLTLKKRIKNLELILENQHLIILVGHGFDVRSSVLDKVFDELAKIKSAYIVSGASSLKIFTDKPLESHLFI